jgi:hypothetical protein
VDELTETLVAFNVGQFPDVGISWTLVWTLVALLTNPIPVIVTDCDPAEVGLTLAATGVKGTNVNTAFEFVALVPPTGKVVAVT